MILHHRYHRERDLLRRCHNGEQAARTQFANVYQPVIEGTIATTLADTEATATDEAHVANTCVAHIFIHWETVPSRTAALTSRVQDCALRAARAYLKARRKNLSQESTADRLLRVMGNDTTALTVLLRGKYRFTKQVAEDVLQDTIADLLARSSELPTDDAHLKHYLLAALKTHAIDEVRSSQRHRRVVTPLYYAVSISAEDTLITSEQVQRLHACIAQLPSPYREVFTLQVNEHLSLAEIARRLNRSLGTIYPQYQRGLALLRRLMRGER